MPFFLTDWHPPRRRLRRFAWMIALGLAIAAWNCTQPAAALALRLLAALVFGTGTALPGMFRWMYRAMVFLYVPIAWVVGDVLLAVMYFGLIIPLVVCWRALGRGPLQRRLHPEIVTYWQSRFRGTDYRRYFRP